MAGYRGLAATGRSVVALLNRRFADEFGAAARPTAVLAGSADFEAFNSADAVIQLPAVSLYCYRVSVDRETRPGWAGVAGADGVPRIPLRMHFLIAAWDQYVESELEWLGLVVQILESEPTLTGPLLHPSGGWDPGDSVHIIPDDDLALESMSEAFRALTTKYRLSLPYLARVIRVDGRQRAVDDPVATVAAGLEARGAP